MNGQHIGPYVLVRKLGRGGFGEVWLAERRSKFVTTKVAVKLPLDDQVDHEMIRQEATLWEEASGHPNILPIIEAHEYDGHVVIVSEYAPDGSLEQRLKRLGKMPPSEAVQTTIKILNGLEFLHSRNIIHRDLKPANILLQGSNPRLADFGISRALRTSTSSQSSNITGTFAYMSPEGFDGKRSVQTDIWSVGVNLYRFLSGRLPFPQREPSALVAAIMMREFDPLPPEIPLGLGSIVTRSLQKRPEARFASAAQMREELRRVLRGKPVRLPALAVTSSVQTVEAGVDVAPESRHPERHVIQLQSLAAPAPRLPRPKSISEPVSLRTLDEYIDQPSGRWKYVGMALILGVLLATAAYILVSKLPLRVLSKQQHAGDSPGRVSTNSQPPSGQADNHSAFAPRSSPRSASPPGRSKVKVRLLPTWIDHYGTSISDPGAVIKLTTSTGTFTGTLNGEGMLVFDNIPCNREITVAVPSDNDDSDRTVNYKRFIHCRKPVVDLGE